MEKLCAFLKKNVSALVVVIWWIVTLVACGYGLFYDNAIVAWVDMGLLIVVFFVIIYVIVKQIERQHAERMKVLGYAMELKWGWKVEFIHIYGEFTKFKKIFFEGAGDVSRLFLFDFANGRRYACKVCFIINLILLYV